MTRLHALTMTALQQHARDFYMSAGPTFGDPVARQLFAEIASTEEQHLTQYESVIDPRERLLEKWLLHEAAEAFNYWSCCEQETDPKVRAIKTPPAILDAQLKAWDGVITKFSGENALFAKVIESQRAWAQRVVYWSDEVTVDSAMAYRHFFPKGPLGA